ncbi:MAG: large repetitive protein [Acidobacteriota bacterium]|nr:large repetitive protein [Acidobacteriota bacterium]
MKKSFPRFALRRFRTHLALLLAYLTLITPLAPVFAQSVKVKRAAAPAAAQGTEQPGKGKGPTIGIDKHITLPAPGTLSAGPIISATKTDGVPLSTLLLPGDTITYSVTISNTGNAPATNVQLSDTIDPNTTLVPTSFVVAGSDDYNTIGNVQITVPAAQGVLANDTNPDTGNNSGMTASTTTSTTSQGGTVTLSPDGSFTYDPPTGFTGTDTFNYTTTTSGGKTATSSAKITIVGKIWFVNNNAGACTSSCDGRLSHPFQTLAAFNAVNNGTAGHPAAGDSVFLYESATAYFGPVTLLANQKFIGQDATTSLISLTGLTQPSGTDPLPVMNSGNATIVNITTTTAATNAITVSAGGELLRGFTVGNTTGAKIFGSSFGTLTVGNNVSPDVTLNGTGQALNLTSGSFAVTSGFNGVTTTSATSAPGISLTTVGGTVAFGSTNVSGSGTQGISIAGSGLNANFGATTISTTGLQGILIGTSTGALTFGATSVTGGTDAVSFQNNSAGSRTFASLTTLNNNGVAFLHGGGGGTTTVTGATSITNPAGRGIDIQNSTTLVTFANTNVTQSGGTGVNLATNSGGVVFADLDISPDSGVAALAAASSTITATSGTITTTNAAAITLSASALALTFDSVSATISNATAASGVALTGANTGSLVMNAGAISGGGAAAFSINAGTANVTYNGTITQANAQRVVDVQSKTGGTVAFGGAISSTSGTGTGINLATNTGATINFTGGIALTTNANAAFTATGGGTVSATQNNSSIVNTLTTTTATALNVTSTTIGASGLTFRSITSNGSGTGDGIILNGTGATAGLTITANGGTCTAADQSGCSGGTISNKTGADGSTTQGTGIYLSSTVGVSLDRMFLHDFQNHAIYGTNVTGFSLTNSNITGTNGTSSAGGSREGDVHFDNLFTSASFPTAQITNSNLGGTSFSDVLRVFNTSGTLNRLNVANVTFGNVGINGNDGMSVAAFNNATLNVTLQDSILTNSIGEDLRVNANNTSVVDMVVRRNKFSNSNVNASSGAGLISFAGGGAGSNTTQTYDISCNSFRDAIGIAVIVASNGGSGTTTGSFINNVIGVAGSATLTGSTQASGFKLAISGSSGTHNIMIANNDVRRTNEEGIFIQNNNGTATVNASVFGNIVAEPGPFQFTGLNVDIGAGVAGDASKINVVVGSATVAAQKNDFSNGDPSNFSDVNFSLNTPAGGFINLSKNGSAAATTLQVIRDDNNNPATTTVSASGTVTLVNTLPTTPPAVASCTVPPIANFGDVPPPEPTSASVTVSSVSQPSAQSGDVISRPFVSLPQVAKVKTEAAQVATQTSALHTQQSPVSKDGASAKQPPSTRIINSTQATFPIAIGTINAGDSVTITFQVTINTPFTGANAYVENQGSISYAESGTPVLTDDPETPTPNDKTRTNVLAPPKIRVNDAKVTEPTTGTTNMLFTVTLDHAYPGGTTVSYSTADGTATGGTCGAAGIDYQTVTGGSLVFGSTETVKTIAIPVCADNADNTSADETFLLNLTGATTGTFNRNQATGTITDANTPGTLLITELRTSGPTGAGDDFVELYNNTANDLSVADGTGINDTTHGYGVFKMGTDCNAAPVLIGVIPNTTVIKARTHYLLTGSQYSLANYGGTNAAVGDLAMTSDIEDDHNVAVFSTADVLTVSTANRLDAVGFGTNTTGVCDLLHEGATLPALGAQTLQYSFFRNLSTGLPADTNDNFTDFFFADTQATVIAGVQQRLGAPGPENKTSPINRGATIKSSLLDATQSSSLSPNRVRNSSSYTDVAPTVGSGTGVYSSGTLSIRRRFTNNTGGNVTRLRFRVVQMTTLPAGAGVADLRLITSSDVSQTGINDAATCTASGTSAPNCTVTVRGTTLEQPPTQTLGGGYNSTVGAGTVATGMITTGTPLGAGNSINLQFLLGVKQAGSFTFLVIVEALP